jgi:hypothetical protein
LDDPPTTRNSRKVRFTNNVLLVLAVVLALAPVFPRAMRRRTTRTINRRQLSATLGSSGGVA